MTTPAELPVLPPPAEAERLRCHWLQSTPDEVAEGYPPWVLIPGCTAMVTNPESGCACHNLWWRLQLQIAHRRDADQAITHLRRRGRRWARAAGLAVEALTGRPQPAGVWQPEDLERAARHELEVRR